jgi:methyl-accepting chemotaxis protein
LLRLQKKLAAAFLCVTLLCLLGGLLLPRLVPDAVSAGAVLVSWNLLVGLGAAWLLSARLTRRLRSLAEATGRISRGDLRVELVTTGDDETAELARAFATMVDEMLRVLIEVQATAERLAESTQALSATSERMHAVTADIAGTTRGMAHGAEVQAHQIQLTSGAMRELLASVETVASRAVAVHGAAAETSMLGSAGSLDARRAAEALATLAEAIGSSAAVVDGFQQQAEDIGRLITAISSVSQQTHLLAINAAIEAARAGEHGRGFAVVAEEVQRLSDDVRALAERVSALSGEILDGARAAAGGIRRTVDAASGVRTVVERTAFSFDRMRDSLSTTTAQVREISDLAARQRGAAERVARSLEEISKVAGESATGAEQSSAASEAQARSARALSDSAATLAHNSERLRALTGRFQVR